MLLTRRWGRQRVLVCARQVDVCHALATFFLNVLEHYGGDDDARRWDKWEVMAPGAGSTSAFREFAWTYACETGLARAGDPCCDVHRRAAVWMFTRH